MGRRVPDPTDIYRSQTSMLQWLRRRGHRVDFSNNPTVTGEIFTADPPGKRFNGQHCPYCLHVMMTDTRRHPTRDHVKPRRAGGTLADSNRLIVCMQCNSDKADMMLAEFVDWLQKRSDARASIVQSVLNSRSQ